MHHLNSKDAHVWLYKPENIAAILSPEFSRDERSLKKLRQVVIEAERLYVNSEQQLKPLWNLINAGPQV